MVDILGQELNIGDKVVTTTPHYEELSVGYIIAFTPLKARVTSTVNSLYSYSKLKFSNQLVKVK